MASAMLEAAQESHEAAQEQCRRRDELIAQLPAGAKCQTFWWRNERFEAKLEIFYRPGEPLDIVGCRAVEVDYDVPSAKRRLDIEQRFLEALSEYGPLRDEVTSYLVKPGQ